MKKYLTGFSIQEIAAELNLTPSFRAKQIFKHIYINNAENIEDITVLPKTLRQELSETTQIFSSKIVNQLKDDDSTLKLQIELYDGLKIETVLLNDEAERKTACISTQAGCPMACIFCRTGSLGFKRNLFANEIVEQYLFLKKNFGNIENIVFMGMGEPFLNSDNVYKAISILSDEEGLFLGLRRFTISTSGFTKEIKNLADSGLAVKLAVSLNSPIQEVRNRIMPKLGEKNSIPRLKEALNYYYEKTKKRITLEYVLLGGINDDQNHVNEIKEFCSGFSCIINVIPYNPIDNIDLNEPGREKTRWFIKKLQEKKLNAFERFRRGRGINASCGQLGEL